jgi:hypothetical protein
MADYISNPDGKGPAGGWGSLKWDGHASGGNPLRQIRKERHLGNLVRLDT